MGKNTLTTYEGEFFMKKIKDRIALGVVSSIIAGEVAKFSMYLQYEAGWLSLRFNQPAASLFLPHKEAKANTVEGKIIASVANQTMGGAIGTFVTYLFSFSGRDYAVMKGAGVSLMA